MKIPGISPMDGRFSVAVYILTGDAGFQALNRYYP